MMTNIIHQSFVHHRGRPPAAGFSKGVPQEWAGQNRPLTTQLLLHGSNPLRSSSSRFDHLKPSYSLDSPPEIGPSLWLHRGNCGKDETRHLPASTCGNLAAAETAERRHSEDTKETRPDSAASAAAPSNILRSLLGNGGLGSIRDFLGEFDIFSPDRPCGGGGTVLTVTVASAVRLDGRQVEQIKRKMRRLTGFEHLSVVNDVDPSLIAGLVIRYGGTDDEGEEHVIDLSVKGQLAELQARIETSEKRREEQEQGWTLPG